MALRSLEECENSTLQWCNENARISDWNLSMKQQSANDGHCYQKGTNLDNCMPRGSEDYEVNQLLCGKGIPSEG